MAITKQDVFDYHRQGRPGKIEVTPTKPLATQRDLTLAYSPGVAEAVLEVERDPLTAYELTAKSNLVAVISNGTAILGLGDRGSLASKPVMEGKGVLFKKFADIDVFDIEIDARTPAEMIAVIKAMAPTFGGINLEDIKAPECFEVERTLREMLPIPVFHDDQHGTAIISGAALLNACEVLGKRLDTLRVVINGAGASAIASGEFYVGLGIRRENILMVDSKGVLYAGREDNLNEYKARFLNYTHARTLEEALVGADVMLGLSVAGSVTQAMVEKMAPNPIIFALANPTPEIMPEEVLAVRPDAITGTGRSDYANQVNNVLGFPFIFRGALDVYATTINEEMKLAAARGLAALAHEDVPDSVLSAYGLTALKFGRDYLIPKPLDPRVLLWLAPAVAEAAMRTGVARRQIDLDEYREELIRRQGAGQQVRNQIISKAKLGAKKRIVFPEGDDPKIIRAAARVQEEGIGIPILLGRPEEVRRADRGTWLELRAGDLRTVGGGGEAPRVCRRALRHASAQRRQPDDGGSSGGQPHDLRLDDAAKWRCRRLPERALARIPRRDPPGAANLPHPPRREDRQRRLHYGRQTARLFLHRRDRQHRPRRRDAGGDRHPGGGFRAHARHRAARRHALVLEFRLRAASALEQGARCRPPRADEAPGHPLRWRDAGGYRRHPRHRGKSLSVQPRARRQHPRLPGFAIRQCVVQAAVAVDRRRSDWTDPAGRRRADPRLAGGR
jgi:malic enzyme